MADEAYRAVFLRVHPTGKMVLSLTTEPDGKEAEYAQLVADELGVPALDVKVVPADTDRFGVGHGYNTSPSDGTPAAIVSAAGKIRAKAQLLAGTALGAAPETLEWVNGRVGRRGRKRPDAGQDDRGDRPLRARQRRPAARGRGRARRADRLPRLIADAVSCAADAVRADEQEDEARRQRAARTSAMPRATRRRRPSRARG